MENLRINELVIAIAAPSYEPSLLHPNALKYNGTVPEDWTLADQPVISQQGSRMTFSNGLQIVAQPGRCLVLEPWNEKTKAELESPGLAQRYVSTLANLNYQAVGVNLRAYLPFEGDTTGPQDYICKQLLAGGEWQRCEAVEAQQELKFTYGFERCVLTLNINSATYQEPDQPTMPILLFSANFEYRIGEDASVDRATQVQRIIGDWQADLKQFKDVLARFPMPQSVEAMAAA